MAKASVAESRSHRPSLPGSIEAGSFDPTSFFVAGRLLPTLNYANRQLFSHGLCCVVGRKNALRQRHHPVEGCATPHRTFPLARRCPRPQINKSGRNPRRRFENGTKRNENKRLPCRVTRPIGHGPTNRPSRKRSSHPCEIYIYIFSGSDDWMTPKIKKCYIQRTNRFRFCKHVDGVPNSETGHSQNETPRICFRKKVKKVPKNSENRGSLF